MPGSRNPRYQNPQKRLDQVLARQITCPLRLEILGDWLRRLKSKLGTKAAVTAAAHKLVRILRAMVKHRRSYNPERLGNPELARARKERYLRRQAEQLGFALTPIHWEAS